jgi:hypothetical protein
MTRSYNLTTAHSTTVEYAFSIASRFICKGITGAIKCSANTLNGNLVVKAYPTMSISGTQTAVGSGTALTTISAGSTTMTALTPAPGTYGPPFSGPTWKVTIDTTAASSGSATYDLTFWFEIDGTGEV